MNKNDISEKVQAEIDKAVGSPIREDYSESIRKTYEAAGKPTDKPAKSRLDVIQPRHANLEKIKTDNTHIAADARRNADRQVHVEGLAEGTDVKPLRPLAHYLSEAAEAAEAAHHGQQKLTSKASPDIITLAESVAAPIEQMICELARNEVALYQKFGIAYPGPSVLLQRLQKIPTAIRSNAAATKAQGANRAPKDVFPFMHWE